MTNTLPTVGATFTSRDRSPWRDADGVRHYHVTVNRCRVVSVDHTSFAYEIVELVEESDAPTAFAPRRFQRGVMLTAAIAHRIDTGEMVWE